MTDLRVSIGLSDEIHMRPRRWKMFVSSEMRSGELTVERQSAAKAIESSGQADAWYWERDGVAGPYSAELTCVREASTSDALILLIADKVTPIVKKEYEAAQRAGVPCFPFIKEGVLRDSETSAFVRQVRDQGHVTEYFRDPNELHSKVVEALAHFAIRAWRRSVQRSRLTTVQGNSPSDSSALAPMVIASPSRSYERITINLGSPDNPPLSLSQVLGRANQDVSAGHFRGALDVLGRTAEVVRESGFADTTLELLPVILSGVPREAVQDDDWAWLLNTEGLALGALGHIQEARAKFDEMRQVGEHIGDQHIVATAFQNAALTALLEGDLDEALKLGLASYEKKMAIGDARGVVQVASNLAATLLEQGHLDLAADMLAANEKTIKELGDPTLLPGYHGSRGNVEVKRGNLAEAERHFRSALTYARQAGNVIMELQSLQNLAATCVDQGEFGKAIRWYRRALRFGGSIAAPRHEKEIHIGLAVALYGAKRYSESANHFRHGREIARDLGDRHGWATLSADLGAVILNSGDAKAAVSVLSQSLDAIRELGSDEWEAKVLTNLLEAHAAAGEVEQASHVADAALHVLPLEKRDERARVMLRAALNNLNDRERLQSAADYFDLALIELRPTTDSVDWAQQAMQAAASLAQQGGFALAIPFFTRALEIFERIGDANGQFRARNDRAIALTNLQRFEEARLDFDACRAIAKSRNDQELKFQTALNRGEMERRAGEADRAVPLIQMAVDLSDEVADRTEKAAALGNLGIALSDLERWDEAKDAFVAARGLAREYRHQGAEAMAVGGLARIAFAAKKYKQAADLYRRAVKLQNSAGNQGGLIEDLAGLVESLAAIGSLEEVQTEGQRLVDAAQETGYEQVAAVAFMRVADQLLERDLREEAADTFSAAIVLDLFAARDASKAAEIGAPVVALVSMTQTALPTSEQEAFLSQCMEAVEDRYDLDPDILDFLRKLMRAVQLELAQDSGGDEVLI